MSERKRLKPTDDDPEADLKVEELGDSKALEELESIQQQLDQLNDEFSDKVLALEQQYSQKRRPVYARRAEYVLRIPQFWQLTLINHPALRETCTEEDINVLAHCTEMDVVDHEDIKTGYRITFRFDSRCPYFKNRSLTKHFTYSDDSSLEIRGDAPEWHEGYEPEPEEEEDEPPAGSKRPARGGGRQYLFFKWFNADVERLPPGQHDDVADILKEDIWPNPLKYYLAEEEEDLEQGALENDADAYGDGDGDDGFEQGGDDAEAVVEGDEQYDEELPEGEEQYAEGEEGDELAAAEGEEAYEEEGDAGGEAGEEDPGDDGGAGEGDDEDAE